MMSIFWGLLTLIVAILAIHVGVEAYLKIQNKRQQEQQRSLDVLRVITKEECYQRFSGEAEEFEKWIAEFLSLKGYKNIVIMPKENLPSKDLVAENRSGQTVHVLSKLRNPQTWEQHINRSEVLQFVGGLVGDSVKHGLIITTAALDQDAKDYLVRLNGLGYQIQIIEGDALGKELAKLRKKQLVPIHQSA